MKKAAISLLRELTEAHSISGHEEEVRQIMAKQLGGVGDLSSDRTGSIFCELGKTEPRVMLACHMDEVGFLVQNITPNGFLQFLAIGGWWEHNLLAQRVEILTDDHRKILGVISSRPPHFLPDALKRQLMGVEQMVIDVGARSRQEAESWGIRIGSPIAPVSSFTEMNQRDWFIAKAFDNRVGVAGVIQAGQRLAKQDLPNRLILTGTVQEEVGLRGARTAAQFAHPDVAIVLEGPPADDTPGFNLAESQGRIGGGVQIRLYDPTAIANPRLAKLAVETAAEHGINHQVTVRRSGGTDAGAIHLANQGIPTLVLGVPARYIHSHNAIIDVNDYLEMIRLVEVLIKKLDAETVSGLTKFL